MISQRNSSATVSLATWTWLGNAVQGRWPQTCSLLCLHHCTLGETRSRLKCWCSDSYPVRVASSLPCHVCFPCPPLPPPSPTGGAQGEPGASANAQDVFSSACVCPESEPSSTHLPHPFRLLETEKRQNKWE